MLLTDDCRLEKRRLMRSNPVRGWVIARHGLPGCEGELIHDLQATLDLPLRALRGDAHDRPRRHRGKRGALGPLRSFNTIADDLMEGG